MIHSQRTQLPRLFYIQGLPELGGSPLLDFFNEFVSSLASFCVLPAPQHPVARNSPRQCVGLMVVLPLCFHNVWDLTALLYLPAHYPSPGTHSRVAQALNKVLDGCKWKSVESKWIMKECDPIAAQRQSWVWDLRQIFPSVHPVFLQKFL